MGDQNNNNIFNDNKDGDDRHHNVKMRTTNTTNIIIYEYGYYNDNDFDTADDGGHDNGNSYHDGDD